MLELLNISKSYQTKGGTVHALREITLAVNAGEFVAVQGPSGCGKSTLLAIAGALQAPDAGSVRICGEDPYTLAPDAQARFRATHSGFVFQQFHLVPFLSVFDNILSPSLAVPLPNAHARARELIGEFGLGGREHHVPSQLSTGERQRVALARALLNHPKLLLADEPTGNLDPENAGIILDHLMAFSHSGGAVLLVTHDVRIAARAQRIFKMKEGRYEA